VSARFLLHRLAPRFSALAIALAISGCAAHSPAPRPGSAASRPAIAVLPLENLSGHAEYGERFSRLVWAEVGRTARYQIVDVGEVDAMLVEFRIRSAGSLTREQVLKASGRLRTRWILAGALLECGTIRTPDGELPTFTLALRLLDGKSGNVVWTDVRARSGEDRETVFGWGREASLERLAASTARELVSNMRVPRTTDSLQTTEGRP
jgi:TolB-like protein